MLRQRPYGNVDRPLVAHLFPHARRQHRVVLDLGRISVEGLGLLAASVPLGDGVEADLEHAAPELEDLRVDAVDGLVKLVDGDPDGDADVVVEHLLLLVALRLDELEERLEEAEVAQPSRLIVELFRLSVLRDGDEDVRVDILEVTTVSILWANEPPGKESTYTDLENVEEWVVPRRAPQVGLDLLQLRLSVAVDGHNDAIGEQTVEAEERGHQMMPPQFTRRRRHTDSSLYGPTLMIFCHLLLHRNFRCHYCCGICSLPS